MGELVDYDWDPRLGTATLTYEDPGDKKHGIAPSTWSEIRCQPTNPKHVGWHTDSNVRAFIDHNVPFPVRPL